MIIFYYVLVFYDDDRLSFMMIMSLDDDYVYDDYRCLVASNKQQIQWTKIRRNPQEHWIIGNSKAGADSSNHEVVLVMKGCADRPTS